MNKNIEALNVYDTLKLALEALDQNSLFTSLMPGYDGRIIEKAYKAINKSLAEQPAPVAEVREQQSAERVEPFGIWHQGETEEESDFFLYKDSGDVSCPNCIKLYTSAPYEATPLASQRSVKPWRGLTDEEADELVQRFARYELLRAIEAKLRERNEHREKNA